VTPFASGWNTNQHRATVLVLSHVHVCLETSHHLVNLPFIPSLSQMYHVRSLPSLHQLRYLLKTDISLPAFSGSRGSQWNDLGLLPRHARVFKRARTTTWCFHRVHGLDEPMAVEMMLIKRVRRMICGGFTMMRGDHRGAHSTSAQWQAENTRRPSGCLESDKEHVFGRLSVITIT
jgi:hypothetical protein